VSGGHLGAATEHTVQVRSPTSGTCALKITCQAPNITVNWEQRLGASAPGASSNTPPFSSGQGEVSRAGAGITHRKGSQQSTEHG
jgi:hypothetical protein